MMNLLPKNQKVSYFRLTFYTKKVTEKIDSQLKKSMEVNIYKYEYYYKIVIVNSFNYMREYLLIGEKITYLLYFSLVDGFLDAFLQ